MNYGAAASALIGKKAEDLTPVVWARMVEEYVNKNPDLGLNDLNYLLVVPCNGLGQVIPFEFKYFTYLNKKRERVFHSVKHVQRFWIQDGVVWFQDGRKYSTNCSLEELSAMPLAREVIRRMLQGEK